MSEETLATCGPNFCPAQLVEDTKEETATENDNFKAASAHAQGSMKATLNLIIDLHL